MLLLVLLSDDDVGFVVRLLLLLTLREEGKYAVNDSDADAACCKVMEDARSDNPLLALEDRMGGGAGPDGKRLGL